MDYARNLFKSLVAPKDSITNDEPYIIIITQMAKMALDK